MKPFDLAVLLAPTLLIGALTYLVTMRVTRNAATAAAAAVIKAGLFVAYFGLFFDGTYTFLDDISYLEGGAELLQDGVGVVNLSTQWDLVLAIGRGEHFLYYLYNAYAFRLFGEGYFAPVACNVLLTVAVAFFGMRLARTELKLPRHQARWLYVFLLLHPDILAWSTVPNGKDILTLLMHVLLLQAAAFFLRGKWSKAFLLGTPVCVVLTFLRFYVPFMFVAALVLGSIITRHERGYTLRVALGVVLLGAAIVGLGGQLDYAFDVLSDTLVNPLYGFVRVLMTPIPFNTEEAFAFLNIPALIHWLLLPFLAIGLGTLWRIRTPFTRFFIVYTLLFLCLYALVGELQGPRHRVQLDYAIALLQFVGLLTAARRLHLGKVTQRPRERMSTVRAA